MTAPPPSPSLVRRATPRDALALARLRWEFRAGLAPAGEGEAAFAARCEAWMASRLGVHQVLLWPTERSRPLYARFGFAVRDDHMARVVAAPRAPLH